MTTRRTPASIRTCRAGRSASLVVARLQGHYRRRAVGQVARCREGLRLGVSLTLPLVETLADDLAICADHDTAHGRIRACRAKACR